MSYSTSVYPANSPPTPEYMSSQQNRRKLGIRGHVYVKKGPLGDTKTIRVPIGKSNYFEHIYGSVLQQQERKQKESIEKAKRKVSAPDRPFVDGMDSNRIPVTLEQPCHPSSPNTEPTNSKRTTGLSKDEDKVKPCKVVLHRKDAMRRSQPKIKPITPGASTEPEVETVDFFAETPTPRKPERPEDDNDDEDFISTPNKIRRIVPPSWSRSDRDKPSSSVISSRMFFSTPITDRSILESARRFDTWNRLRTNAKRIRVTRQRAKGDVDSTKSSTSRKLDDAFGLELDDSEEDEELQEALMKSLRVAQKTQKLEVASAKLPAPLSGPPLTQEMIDLVKTTFRQPPDTKIRTKFGITIKQPQFDGFNGRQWLEDGLIDFYLEMIKERNELERLNGVDYPKIYIFRSFMFKFCHKNEFEAMNGAAEDNIFEYDLIFFPIIIRDHWRLIVANTKNKTLSCYDSMFRVNDQNLTTITRYLEREYRRKVQKLLDWTWSSISNSFGMSPESEHDNTLPSIHDDDSLSVVTEVLTIDKDYSADTPPDEDVEKVLLSSDDVAQGAGKGILLPVVVPWETYSQDWETITLEPDNLPQQKNGYDCGIFLCQYAESLARGVDPPFDFAQVNMSYFRYLMGYETIQGMLVERGVRQVRLANSC